MSGLHEACARAIASAWDEAERVGVVEDDLGEARAAAAAVGVCLAEAQRAVEALPGSGRGDHGESLPGGELLGRSAVLAVLAALAEEQA